ncbi:hypothetical protein F183_A40840 [Bryobacterales bacterium F-183]|nr:hypothetical protein F183_A40840 [Bryobacterales bacterium F-183]
MQFADLTRFDVQYAQPIPEPTLKAPTQPGPLSLPDGKYRVVVERLDLTVAKNTGQPMLKWWLRVAGGQFDRRLMFKNRVITDSTLEWVRKEMLTCGLELTPFSSLPHRIGELVGAVLAVSKVTKSGYENIYINRRLTPQQETETAEQEDALPF